MEDTKQRLKEILIQALRLNQTAASLPETNVASELGIDSIKSLEFLVWVENEFKIEIDDSDLSAELLDSFDYLATYVDCKRTGAPVPDPNASKVWL